MRDPFIAGILSLIVPGLGQIYNGRILAGIVWLFLALFFWGWTGGLLGWVFHIIAPYCAYSYAKEHRVRI
jgi:TM2 domain-containing membrane protein YozV